MVINWKTLLKKGEEILTFALVRSRGYWNIIGGDCINSFIKREEDECIQVVFLGWY